jgi:hypothetical protein
MNLSRIFNEINDDLKKNIDKQSKFHVKYQFNSRSIYLFIFISSFKNSFNQFLTKNDFDE